MTQMLFLLFWEGSNLVHLVCLWIDAYKRYEGHYYFFKYSCVFFFMSVDAVSHFYLFIKVIYKKVIYKKVTNLSTSKNLYLIFIFLVKY